MKASIKPHSRQRREKLDYIVPGITNFNNSDDPTSVEDTVVTGGLNLIYDNTGAVQTARGYARVNTTNLPAPLDNGWMLETPALRQLVVSTTAGYLYRSDNAGGWITLGGPYTASASWGGFEMRNKLVLFNGFDGILTWDGTTLATVTVTGYAAIKPQFGANRKNRAYFAEKNSSLVWFTDPLDITTIQSNSYIQVNTDDGQSIVGLDMTVDNLTIGKDRSVWNIIGEPLTAGATTYVGNLQIRKSNSEVGPVSAKSICTIANGVQIFVATSGVYTHQNYRTQNITPELNQLFRDQMNPNFRHLTWSVYNPLEKKVLIGYCSLASSTPDKVIMLDLSGGQIKISLWDDYSRLIRDAV